VLCCTWFVMGEFNSLHLLHSSPGIVFLCHIINMVKTIMRNRINRIDLLLYFKITHCLDVMSCNLIEVDQHFGGMCHLHLTSSSTLKTLKTEAVYASKAVMIYQTIWCHILEVSALHTCKCENFKSFSVIFSIVFCWFVIFSLQLVIWINWGTETSENIIYILGWK
jgi:hypothetical protein